MIPWLILYGLGAGVTFVLGLVMAADITPAADSAGTLGAFDAAVDLLIFVAPALALATYEQIGQVMPILLAVGLPALIALPVAVMTRETRQPAIGMA
jgi:cyanate permease